MSLLIMGRALSLQQKTMENLIPVNRRYGYYVNTAVGADFQKDFRLFQMQPMIERKVESYVKSINLWFGPGGPRDIWKPARLWWRPCCVCHLGYAPGRQAPASVRRSVWGNLRACGRGGAVYRRVHDLVQALLFASGV